MKTKKQNHKYIKSIVSVVLILVVTTALIFAQIDWVGNETESPSNNFSGEATPTITLAPSPTLTPVPTPTSTPTPTLAPTPTLTPTPTLIPHYSSLPDGINSLQEAVEFSVNYNNTSDNILVRVSTHDLDSDEKAGLNEKLWRHPASTIKTIFYLFFLEDVVEGKRDLNEIRVLQESDKWTSTGKVEGTGILKDADVGTEYTWQDLLYLMMIKSDNVATNIVIMELGIENIRNRIDDLGLKNTNFLGLIYDAKATSCSAEDLAIVLKELYVRSLENQIYKDGLELMKLAEGRLRIKLYLEGMDVYHKPGHDFNVYADTGLVFYDEQMKPVVISIFVSTIDRTELSYDYARELIGQISYDIVEYVSR